MRLRRWLTLTVLAPLLVGVSYAPASADSSVSAAGEVAWQLGPPPVLEGGWTGISYDEGTNLAAGDSYMVGITTRDGSTNSQLQKDGSLCKTLQDDACKNADVVAFRGYLPMCSDPNDTNCLEYLSATPADKSEVKAKFLSKFPKAFANDFKGDPKRGVPDGGGLSLFDIPDAPHEGGSKYLVAASLISYWWSPKKPMADVELSIGIFPVEEVQASPGSYIALSSAAPVSSSRNFVLSGTEGSDQCLKNDTSLCLKRVPFPKDTKFKLSFRATKNINGWLDGRLGGANILSTPLSTLSTRFEVSGVPLDIPVLGVWAKNSTLPTSLNELLDSQLTGGKIYYSSGGMTRPELAVMRGREITYNEQSFKEFQLWLSVAGDKAAAMKSTWSLRSMNSGNANAVKQQYGNCEDGTSLSGIVSTNSTMYISGPPTFDTNEMNLNYHVGAPHFDSKSNILKGSYDLLMRSEIARCIYKFTSAPLKATVDVISADGTQQVVTDSLSESGGWLHLSASGFTYSTPTVKVKLVQSKVEASVVPAPIALAPAASPQIAGAKKSITCVKGKMSKRVTAVNPQCPVGYKLK